jgi:sRNA-binding protein
VREALRDYCSGPRYLLGILDAEGRIVLDVA